MIPIIIKFAVSAVLSFLSGPLLAEMICVGKGIPDGLVAITCVLVFFWSYCFLSCTTYALHFGIGCALIVGILAISISGAIAIGDAFLCLEILYNGQTLDDINSSMKEFWILMIITVVLFLTFPVIDIVKVIRTIRDKD